MTHAPPGVVAKVRRGAASRCAISLRGRYLHTLAYLEAEGS